VGSFLSTVLGALASRLGWGERTNGADRQPPETPSPGAVRFAAKLMSEADAAGWIAASLDPASGVLTWAVEYSELEGEPTRAYFSVAEIEWDGEPDPDRLLLSEALASPINGSARLTAAQIANLTGGKWTFTLEAADDRLSQALEPAP
jgi:hypothetical protein